jgi:hypothetical protein
MERLSYRFISLFASGIVAVSLFHVMERPIPFDNPQKFYKTNPSSENNNLSAGRNQSPLNLTQPIYRTPVIFSQTFPGAIHQNVQPPPVMQPFRNQMDQRYTAAPVQSPAVQTQKPLKTISMPDKKSFVDPLRKAHHDPHQYCKKYLTQAAEKTGILPEILWAVAKTESNYKGKPWPWTVNVGGKGYYFPSQEKAKKFLKSLAPSRKYHVDVGCMQVNWGYHGGGFPYLGKMLNPRLNTLYAAHFLKELYQETGNWAKAIAAYHSRNQSLGNPYAMRVAHMVKTYVEE